MPDSFFATRLTLERMPGSPELEYCQLVTRQIRRPLPADLTCNEEER
jgi:hypothetical protein